MPCGVKGSGKKPVNAKKTATEKKERKPYPTYQERIEAADKKIEQLQQLNASREELIAQTEAKLAERKEALAKSEEALEKVLAKREHLVALMNKPEKQPKPKLSPEERAAHRREALAKAREAKKARKRRWKPLWRSWPKAARPLRSSWRSWTNKTQKTGPLLRACCNRQISGRIKKAATSAARL